jgi:hypothetical protein
MDKQLKQLKESWKQISEKEKLVGGKADGKTLQDVAAHHAGNSAGRKYTTLYYLLKHQLELGLKVEKEHSNSKEEAEEITLDHLWEDPEYYTKLATIHKD